MASKLATREKPEHSGEPVRIDCLLACLYFTLLPFTVVTTPFGSLLKVMTVPIVALLGLRILSGKVSFTLNYVHLLYTLYILYTVSQLITYRTDRAYVTTRDMVLGLMMLAMVSIRIYNRREREWIESAWLVVGLVCIIAALNSKEVLSATESRIVVRILGYEEDQNHFCSYFIMAMLISVKRFLERRRFYPAYLLVLILSFYSILRTGSRGGLIGVLCGLAAYGLFGIKSIRMRLAVVLAGAAVIFLVFTVVVPSLPEDLMQRYSLASVLSDGATGRFDIWRYLVNYTMRSPSRMIWGSGVNSTYEILYGAGFANGVAHNTFLQVFNDQGMIGLLLFLILIAACFGRNAVRQPLYACALTAIMAFAMSLTFYIFKPYLNIMMMCAMTFEDTLPEHGLTNRGEESLSYV